MTGLRHDDIDERDDDRSHRCVSIMSSLDVGLIPADHEYLDSVA